MTHPARLLYNPEITWVGVHALVGGQNISGLGVTFMATGAGELALHRAVADPFDALVARKALLRAHRFWELLGTVGGGSPQEWRQD